MIYKPEAVVDLDTGAIVASASAHWRSGPITRQWPRAFLEAQQNINQAAGEKLDTLTVNTGHVRQGLLCGE